MPDPLAKPNRPKPNPLEGAALIIVLSCLVLLAALAIGLLNRVEADRTNASAYRGSTLTRNLAEYAINVVMAQISSATSGSNAANTWASQPGAIRVYTNNAATLVNIYKLYSSSEMTNAAFPSADITALSSWANNTALFTDLNARVVSGTGASARTNYPILDPSAVGSVQGFAISGAPTTTTQPAPMPVNWLYVLEDGTLVPPASAAGNNTVTVTGATAANPIVGRIAFWTDDDTSKININTASGAPWNYTNTLTSLTAYGQTTTAITNFANYWDTPVVGSAQDVNLALSQPWAGEYQRYPGHPATVSLSAVFTNLSTNDIMAITPRVNYQNNTAGSRWGSFVAVNTAGGNQNVFKLQDDGARLYANVDELLFATNRPSVASITPQQIEQGRFFLTASSRAPDVTLFNTPRLLAWPITTTKPYSAYDQLITFCGAVGNNTSIGGPNSYYFTRQTPTNAITDYNIPRNQTLLAYFRRMTSQAVPGFGGSSGILGKYGASEAEQITTEIFDYIRCINVRQNLGSGGIDTTYMYSTNGIVIPTAGAGNTRGFGRFTTVSKVGMMFWFDKTNVVGGTTNVNLCARLHIEGFIPSHGHPGAFGSVRYIVGGLTNLTWGTNSDGVGAVPVFSSATNTNFHNSGGIHGRADKHGGRVSVTGMTANGTTNSTSPNFATNSTNLYFSGGNISISVANTNLSYTNQVINLYIPPLTNAPFPQDTIDYNGHDSWSWNVSGTRIINAAFTTLDRVFRPQDVVRSVGVTHGDFRLTAASAVVGTNSFSAVTDYSTTNATTGRTRNLVHNFLGEYPYTFSGATFPQHYSRTSMTNLSDSNLRWVNGDAIQPHINASQNGDFDNGYGAAGDGPYIGFADEGNTRIYESYAGAFVPYLDGSGALQLPSEGYFSPNRLVPSAGIMGSLPTGVISQTPWQTLLFRPRELTSSSHRGLSTPPDYLLLDLFNMPVVEPYAISEPLSTAGRVNMNYQILPFTYIKRPTAVQAALHTEWILAINDSTVDATDRKTGGPTTSASRNSRYTLNLNTNTGTLRGFEDRFASGDIFRSAAEICTIPLVPNVSGASYSTMATWWPNYALTGDNSKERPYARIYPKLTTKSNTYTVHYRVEVLKKSPNSTTQTTWADGTDKVISTYRGSTTIERYVNPRDPALPDYASITTLPPTGANALPNFYKFRILGERQFNP